MNLVEHVACQIEREGLSVSQAVDRNDYGGWGTGPDGRVIRVSGSAILLALALVERRKEEERGD